MIFSFMTMEPWLSESISGGKPFFIRQVGCFPHARSPGIDKEKRHRNFRQNQEV